MSLFENVESLCGNSNVDEVKPSMQEFFNQADNVQDALKGNIDILKEYLSTILASLDCVDVFKTADRAENISTELYSICKTILSKEQRPTEKSPFYEKAETYIKNNPINGDDHNTTAYFYAANILMENIDTVVADYVAVVKKNILNQVNYEIIKRNYEQLIKMVDAKKIDSLNNLLDKTFIISSISTIFLQALMLKIVDMLLYKNPQSDKKQVFELMMEKYRHQS